MGNSDVRGQNRRPGPNGAGLSRKAIFVEIDASLTRLGMDYIDLYQIHRFDQETPIEETLEALHDVVKAGKVRYIGASSMNAWKFARALGIAEKHGWTRFVRIQNLVNLLYREEEREMLPLLRSRGYRRHPLEPAGARQTEPRLGLHQHPARRPTRPSAGSLPRPTKPIGRSPTGSPKSPRRAG
jgi:aryl-alcohol dehydrogenase-like predicted oxidoreductase